jgi:hypothetical protein
MWLKFFAFSPELVKFVGTHSVCAFDFDQTLSLVKPTEKTKKILRGGEKAAKALEQLVAADAACVIVTATVPTKAAVLSIRNEARSIGLAEIFDVVAFEETKIVSWVRQLPDQLSLDQLTRKLAILLSLYTDRLPCDLARIGYSKTRFSADSSKLFYRLKKADWSAELCTRCAHPRACVLRELTCHSACTKCRFATVYR